VDNPVRKLTLFLLFFGVRWGVILYISANFMKYLMTLRTLWRIFILNVFLYRGKIGVSICL